MGRPRKAAIRVPPGQIGEIGLMDAPDLHILTIPSPLSQLFAGPPVQYEIAKRPRSAERAASATTAKGTNMRLLISLFSDLSRMTANSPILAARRFAGFSSARLPLILLALLCFAPVSAWADDDAADRGERLRKRGDRIEQRLDRKGDRQERRLDRKGDRIEERLDRKGDRIENRTERRADRLRDAGKDKRAARLERKGERIDRKLDRKGERRDRKLDRKGDRQDRRLDRKGKKAERRLDRKARRADRK